MADAKPRAYTHARLTCGGVDKKNPNVQCLHTMHFNDQKMTVECPNMHCTLFRIPFETPSVLLKRAKDD
jgi:hypothetical protein